jgi:hypothetical protein
LEWWCETPCLDLAEELDEDEQQQERGRQLLLRVHHSFPLASAAVCVVSSAALPSVFHSIWIFFPLFGFDTSVLGHLIYQIYDWTVLEWGGV